MNIYFGGAQGTGKSTVINNLSLDDFEPITGITRKVIEENGGNNNKESDDNMQAAIFDAYLIAQYTNSNKIFERSIFDVLAYTAYQVDNRKCSEKELNREIELTEYYLSQKQNDVYIFFPIGIFKPTSDKYRSDDIEYQSIISNLIEDFLKKFNIKYYKIKNSSVSGRVREIKRQVFLHNTKK